MCKNPGKNKALIYSKIKSLAGIHKKKARWREMTIKQFFNSEFLMGCKQTKPDLQIFQNRNM